MFSNCFSDKLGEMGQKEIRQNSTKRTIWIGVLGVGLISILIANSLIRDRQYTSLFSIFCNNPAGKCLSRHRYAQKTYLTELLTQAQFTMIFASQAQMQNPSRLLQNSANNNTNSNLSQSVLLVIIIFFAGVPALSLIIFVVILIAKKCREGQDGQDQTEQEPGNNSHTPQSQVNIQQFNMDQMGPYIINYEDQCVICLDKKANIRTYCGHLFHGKCLKAWFKKKNAGGRKPTCPVCISQQTNPVKIYCKKCYTAAKLDKLSIYISRPAVAQLDKFVCNDCKENQTKQSQNLDSCAQKKIIIQNANSAQKLQHLGSQV